MLHVLAPSASTSSPLLLQLARMAIRQLHQSEHGVVVLGSEQDARQCKSMGLPVLGSIGGVLDRSRTLQKRVSTYLQAHYTSVEKIMAWGIDATVATNSCAEVFNVSALIDEVDTSGITVGCQTCIPTSPTGSDTLRAIGYRARQITEPVFGTEPCSLVVNRTTVRELAEVCEDEFLVSIVGDFGAWQEIIAMAVRLKSAKLPVCFSLPNTFRDRANLMRAAREHGIAAMFMEIPQSLRQIDLLNGADCAWCPIHRQGVHTCGVLDVLEAATIDTPLAVQQSHPVSSLPSIGVKIAWASDVLEVAGWMLTMYASDEKASEQTASRVSAVRAITTPSKFIENIMLRTQCIV